MANQKYNWNEIEQEYVTGKLTYRELADKHNVSESRIGVVGGKRDWAKKRKEYREGINTAAIEEAKKATAFEKGRFDELTTRACDAVVAAMAQQATEAYNAGQLNDKVSKSILSAVREALEIKYRVLDIPLPVQRHDIQEPIKAPGERIEEELKEFLSTRGLTSIAEIEVGGNGADSNLN
jgi:hypothetical protein